MNLNFKEKKSLFKILSILLLVYAGITLLSLLITRGTFLTWVNALAFGAVGVIILIENVENKYVVIPLAVSTLIYGYYFLSSFGLRYCVGVEFVANFLRFISMGLITFYAINLWKKINVPILFKIWYVPAICFGVSMLIGFFGGRLCFMF